MSTIKTVTNPNYALDMILYTCMHTHASGLALCSTHFLNIMFDTFLHILFWIRLYGPIYFKFELMILHIS